MFKSFFKNAIYVAASLFFVSFSFADNPRPMNKHGHMRFEVLDLNGDKKISKEEWMKHFDEIDANKDGFITEQEMDDHHKMMQEKMGRPRNK